MAGRGVRLLCTGDLHLGRYPSKIPEEYGSRDFSPAPVWRRAVRRALELGVDAVLIAGDVVDRDNCYYEAFGPFVAGVRELGEQGIPVFTVTGNHDCDLLPDLAGSIDGVPFHLLGVDGEWECRTLEREGEAVASIVGWSYPQRQVRRDPLIDFTAPNDGLPAVGLLHGEVGNPASTYAPVDAGELQDTGLQGWILGHIHSPHLTCGEESFILQPGSPQPLSPSETGLHAVWEVRIHPPSPPEVVGHPLASVAYTGVEIDVSDLKRLEGLPGLVERALEDGLDPGPDWRQDPELSADWSPGLALARLRLTGRTGLSRELEYARERLADELELEIRGCRILVEGIENLTRPAVDIRELAGDDTLPALLAGYLLQLEAGESEGLPRELVERAEEKLMDVYSASTYHPLRREGHIVEPGQDEVLEILRGQAWLLLDTLLAQKGEAR